jgi:hypothetical protein
MKKTFLALACVLGSFTIFAQVESSNEVTTDSAQATTRTESSQDAIADESASTSVESQAAVSGDTAGVSDEDLRKYAILMDSINDMKKSLLKEMGDMVKNNEGMTNARYNDLSKANGDEAKLKELNATDEEIAFVNQVNERKNEGATQISETFQTMAKDFIGVETYNEVKEALAADSEVKARYDEILAEVEKGDGDSASAQ